MYYITLGHSPELSNLELSALGYTPQSVSPNISKIEGDSFLDQASSLGGITRVIEPLLSTNPAQLQSDLLTHLTHETAKNLAISNYSNTPIEAQSLRELKSQLKRPVRFLSFETSGHSLVALRKQHVAEYSLIEDSGQLLWGKTVWVQDADDWSFRDRRRPYQDIKRGMMPPKLSRILVNLASQGRVGTLLDPYCGTGTLLMEAMLTDVSVVGSDNDPKAVEGAEKNLLWLIDKYQIKNKKYELFCSDATHIDQKLTKVDFIATEPYLGPLLEARALPSFDKLKNIAKGLDKLYRGSLNSWHKLLDSGSRVVIVIPEIDAYGRSFKTLDIDDLKRLGYNYVASVAYRKPQAVVVRNITILERI